MSEKFQYGQKVEYQGKIVADFKTARTHVQYVQTTYHGNMVLMDGEIQYSTQDEHRYHLVLLWGAICKRKRKILILGGGDGLAAKWIYRSIPDATVTIVDWDPEFTAFASMLLESGGSLVDPRTVLVHEDALKYIQRTEEKYDAVIVDLPDPDELEGLYFDILANIERVCAPHAVITMHVGPVSLCKEHPGWTFIRKCKQEMRRNRGITMFDRIYVPSFSHEWGFLTSYGDMIPVVRPHYEEDTMTIPYSTSPPA